MAEILTLTSPEVTPQITTTDYHVIELNLSRERQLIVIIVRGTNNERREFLYEGTTALNLLNILNTANLSIKSLERRILEKLSADGLLVGNVNGTPN